MTVQEKRWFDPAAHKADRLQKLEWLIRVQRKVESRVDVLGASEAIALLKKIEALL